MAARDYTKTTITWVNIFEFKGYNSHSILEPSITRAERIHAAPLDWNFMEATTVTPGAVHLGVYAWTVVSEARAAESTAQDAQM